MRSDRAQDACKRKRFLGLRVYLVGRCPRRPAAGSSLEVYVLEIEEETRDEDAIDDVVEEVDWVETLVFIFVSLVCD